MDHPPGSPPVRATALTAAPGDLLDALRRSWLDVAAQTLPDDRLLAEQLGDRLRVLSTRALVPTEAELLQVAEDAAQHAVGSGSAEAARQLSKRLRRAIYEYLLAVDALLAAGGAAVNTASAAGSDDHAGATMWLAYREDGRPELVWDEPALHVLRGGAPTSPPPEEHERERGLLHEHEVEPAVPEQVDTLEGAVADAPAEEVETPEAAAPAPIELSAPASMDLQVATTAAPAQSEQWPRLVVVELAEAGQTDPPTEAQPVPPARLAVQREALRVPERFRRGGVVPPGQTEPAPLVVPSYRAWEDVLASGAADTIDVQHPRQAAAGSEPVAESTPATSGADPVAELTAPDTATSFSDAVVEAPEEADAPALTDAPEVTAAPEATEAPEATDAPALAAALHEAHPPAPADAEPQPAPEPPAPAESIRWAFPAADEPARATPDAWALPAGGDDAADASPWRPAIQVVPAAEEPRWLPPAVPLKPNPEPVPAAPGTPKAEAEPEAEPEAHENAWSVRRSPRQQALQQRMAQRRRDEVIRAAVSTLDETASVRPRRDRPSGLIAAQLPEQLDGLLRRKRAGEAAALVQRAAQEIGGREIADLALECGDRCRDRHQASAAVNSYLAAWRADPIYEVPLWRLAETCLVDKETDLAVGYLERIADLMRARGDDDGALDVYRKVIAVSPDRGDVRALLQTAATLGRFPD